MNENEAIEQVETGSENTEKTAEETPKIYTEAEMNARVNEIVGKRLARKEAKIRKEYDRKYGDLEAVLRAGTGKENVDEMTDAFTQFYTQKGVKIPARPKRDDEDTAILARAEAEDIIRDGYDEVVSEVDRLSAIGVENMSARDKAVFSVLAGYRQNEERKRELEKLGVTQDVYDSDDFKSFASKFNPTASVKDIYDIYRKTQPEKEHKTMGSMKNTESGDAGVKDFYTFEEARKFTKADFDKNPALFAAVEKSMTKWK